MTSGQQREKKQRTANSTYPKGGVSCSKESFVVILPSGWKGEILENLFFGLTQFNEHPRINPNESSYPTTIPPQGGLNE
jgi:DNA-binding HxlR family transcriptional regulator